MSTIAKAGRRGLTVFARDPTGSIRTRHFAGMADILARGSQTVVPPTLHPSGVTYRWLSPKTLLDTPSDALPIISPDTAEKISAALRPWGIAREPATAPVLVQARPGLLPEHERERHRRYAVSILDRELRLLASMARNTGRNQAAFRLVCRVGRWVHHGIITPHRLTVDVVAACEANGLAREDGRRAVLATIASGLARSAADVLPDLGARHG